MEFARSSSHSPNTHAGQLIDASAPPEGANGRVSAAAVNGHLRNLPNMSTDRKCVVLGSPIGTLDVQTQVESRCPLLHARIWNKILMLYIFTNSFSSSWPLCYFHSVTQTCSKLLTVCILIKPAYKTLQHFKFLHCLASNNAAERTAAAQHHDSYFERNIYRPGLTINMDPNRIV